MTAKNAATVAAPSNVNPADRAAMLAYTGAAPASPAESKRIAAAVNAEHAKATAPHKRGKRERHAHYGLTALRELGRIQGTGTFYAEHGADVDTIAGHYRDNVDDGDARDVLAKAFNGASDAAHNALARWAANAERLLNGDRAIRATAAAELDEQARAKARASYDKACETARAKGVKLPDRSHAGRDATTAQIKKATKLVRAAITLA